MLRTLVFGFIGLLLAGLAVVGYVALQPPPAAQAAAQAAALHTVSVIAAAHEVRAGSLLQPADVTVLELDPASLPPGVTLAATLPDSADARGRLVGAMVRRLLSERAPILAEDVLRPGERGFLAAVLAPGTRAVSVGVDAVSGAAGLIWPGDRVDVILTQTLDAPDQAAGRRVAGETVLEDVRVIAVDQLLVQGGQASNMIDPRGPTSRTITLEVSARDAARIAVATRLGKLQVVLLSARQADEPKPLEPKPAKPLDFRAVKIPAPSAGPVWGGDVSRALGGGGAARDVEVRLYQGTKAVQAYRF